MAEYRPRLPVFAIPCKMVSEEPTLAANLKNARQKIEAACNRCSRSPDSVRLVVVTKYARLEWVRELLSLGVSDLGESRPQQLVERASLIAEPVRWHFIGHLQRNKVRRVLPLATLIHSVDSFRLLDAIDRIAAERNIPQHVLLEVNIAGEQRKHGFSPDELAAGWETVLGCSHLRVDGLMTMAPFNDDPESVRPVFAGLRALRDQLADRSPSSISLPELSMGMSRDFEIAVEEGATIVRIGSDLFRGFSSEE